MKEGLLSLPLFLTVEELYPYLNLAEHSGPLPTHLEELINMARLKVLQLAKPQGTRRVCAISAKTPQRLLLQDASLVVEGPQTVAHFISCEKMTLMAVTLGSKIDAYLDELQRTDTAKAYIFNGVASAAVEYTIEQLDILSAQDIRRHGYFPTARFSPGYGDWPLERQHQFIASLKSPGLNLSVTPHHLLQPIKSVTAIIGWSTLALERTYDSPKKKPCQGFLTCQDCPAYKTCQF